MTVKITKKAYAPELGDPWQAGTDTPDVLLEIPGLRHQPMAGDFTFSLEGVKHRNIDWPMLWCAIGMEETDSGDLADKIGEVIFRHDLIRILSERVKLV